MERDLLYYIYVLACSQLLSFNSDYGTIALMDGGECIRFP